MPFDTVHPGTHAFQGAVARRVRALTENNAKERTYTVGGTASDGVYSLELLRYGVSVGTASFTANATGGDTNNDIATGLRAAWDAVAAIAAVTAAAGGAAAAVDLTFDGYGNEYTITSVAPGSGTLDQTAATHLLNPGTDSHVTVDTSNMAITVDLPPVASCHDGRNGLEYKVWCLSASNDVTIDGDGSETIDGAATDTVSGAYAAVTLLCTGSEWVSG